jgi:predicted DNA-binding WGR domain protein
MTGGLYNRSEQIQLLILDRIDCSRNMARNYVLSVEQTLFDDAALVREWGRIGTAGRRRLDLYAKQADARTALRVWLARKIRMGYRLRQRCEQSGA